MIRHQRTRISRLLNRPVSWFALLQVAFSLFSASPSPAAEARQPSPRLLIHLLEYLSSDYSGAISDQGKVINAGEYREQEEFAGNVLEVARQLEPIRTEPGLSRQFEELKTLIDHRARPAQVSSLALSLKQKVITLTGV